MATFSKEELNGFTDLFDNLEPLLKQKTNDKILFQKIVKEASILFEKNSEVLQTNIIGRQLLVNEKFENSIFSILGLEKKFIENLIKNSAYFKTFGNLKLNSQLVFAIPLIFLAREYEKVKKSEEAQFIFFLTFLKPYASRISQYSKFLNEDQMRFTIEYTLDNSYDIKKYGTLYEVLLKKAIASFENYKELLTEFPTDHDIHVIFNSGIYTRTNDFLKKV